MLDISWNLNIQPVNKKEIEKYLFPYLWLVPCWCQSIHINLFTDSAEGSAVETLVDYEYRFIQIDFYAGWLTQTPPTKQDNVIHELVHGFVNVLYNKARQSVFALEEEETPLQKHLLNELSKTVEQVTQDLTFVIHKKINDCENVVRTTIENA